ncbi:MAG: hypothetical protein IKZ41_06280 [Clostridia bacterium]|nr:hypothetical protein [Clostridia bacterium]
MMLENDNIIEHLDNNGLNCAYDNLHIISSDLNKAKAFTIDKMQAIKQSIPSYVTDVYYSHNKQLYQMQVFLNRDLYFDQESSMPIESFILLYKSFDMLFVDWLYLLKSRANDCFDIRKNHASICHVTIRPLIIPREEEKDYIIFERDGHYFMRLNPDGGEKMTTVEKTVFREIEDN